MPWYRPVKVLQLNCLFFFFSFSPAAFSSKKNLGEGARGELEDVRRREMGRGDGEEGSGKHGQFCRTLYHLTSCFQDQTLLIFHDCQDVGKLNRNWNELL